MSYSIDTFQTPRLVAQRARTTDYDDLCRMHSDPVTMKTLGGVRSDEVTRKFLDNKLTHWEKHGHGMWMFREKQNARFIGRGLLEYIEVGGNEEMELGYSVIAEEWRKGLATEMARAIVSIAFNITDVDAIVSFTWPDNLASRRVMEKNGFTFERDIEHEGRSQVLYRLHREDFTGRPELRVVDGVLVID